MVNGCIKLIVEVIKVRSVSELRQKPERTWFPSFGEGNLWVVWLRRLIEGNASHQFFPLKCTGMRVAITSKVYNSTMENEDGSLPLFWKYFRIQGTFTARTWVIRHHAVESCNLAAAGAEVNYEVARVTHFVRPLGTLPATSWFCLDLELMTDLEVTAAAVGFEIRPIISISFCYLGISGVN